MSIEKQRVIQKNIKRILIRSTFKAKDYNSSGSVAHSHFKLFVNKRQKLLGLNCGFSPLTHSWMELNHSHSKQWGVFCPPGPTLCWCNAPRLCFSDECAREGPLREEGSCCPALNSRETGSLRAQMLQYKELIAHTEYRKVHLVPPSLYPPSLPRPPSQSLTRLSIPESSSLITRKFCFPETGSNSHTSLPM